MYDGEYEIIPIATGIIFSAKGGGSENHNGVDDMANKTEVAGVSVWEKARRVFESYRSRLRMAGMAFSGYVMANCFLFGGISPFGVAFCAALRGRDAICAAGGAVLGYLAAGGVAGALTLNLHYMAATALVVCAKWLFTVKTQESPRYVLMSAVGTSLVCMGICGAASFLLGPRTLYDGVMAFAELFLTCGSAYFFARGMEVLPLGLAGAGRADISSVAIAGCVVLMGLTQLRIGGLSPGRALGVLCILLCARKGREAGGAVSGVAAGVAIGLAGGDYSYTVGAYALGGLAAGIFGQMGRIATASAFIIVNTVTALVTMEFAQVNAAILEVFLASVVFAALPERMTARLLPAGRESVPYVDAGARVALAERLGDVAAALREIGVTTRAVSEKLSERRDTGLAAVGERATERVCARCGLKANCWQLRGGAAQKAVNECVALLRGEGVLPRERLPRHFQQHCCRTDEITAELRSQFNAFLARDAVERKVAKVRAVLTEQFEGMSDILAELSGEVCAAHPIDDARSRRVLDYFLKLGLSPHRFGCATDRFGRLTVELSVPNYQAARVAGAKTALDLCSLLEVDFDLPEIASREKLTTFSFCEKAAYSVELGAYQLPGGGNRLCGDAYDVIRNKGGCAHFFLSDGMGSGGAAAVDSTMACGLLVSLISVGVSYETALRLVNSALLVKSGDESLATIDVCTFDLFTGRARFYKAGAAPTFVIKSGKAGYVETASLPAGILQGVSFEQSGVTLHEGDVIVMISDGVTATGADWIKSELSSLGGGDLQRLCERLALTAKMRRSDGREDDITVLAAKLVKGG